MICLNKSVFFSYQMLTDRTGLSKRAVQRAVAHLARRQLLKVGRKSATAVPEYTVLTPWVWDGVLTHLRPPKADSPANLVAGIECRRGCT